jgi:hypothetical protein
VAGQIIPARNDWHVPHDYSQLSACDLAAMMWEWLRRDPAYVDWCAGMQEAEIIANKGVTVIHQPAATLCNEWGLLFGEAPEIDGAHARLMWSAGVDPFVLRVEALCTGVGFDLQRVAQFATVVIDEQSHEHVVLSNGKQRIRIDVEDGTMLDGPVTLKIICHTPMDIPTATRTLSRANMLWEFGRMPSPRHRIDYRMARLINALRVFDALASGASQQHIARALFGDDRVASEWNSTSDAMRSSVKRLVRLSNHLAAGGYRDLMQVRSNSRINQRGN